jgi:hypothetical protein
VCCITVSYRRPQCVVEFPAYSNNKVTLCLRRVLR